MKSAVAVSCSHRSRSSSVLCAEAATLAQRRHLLVNFDWLQNKLEASGANALIADYDYIVGDHEDLRLIQSAIRLSAHVLVRDPRCYQARPFMFSSRYT